jgi:hypothetical protein
MPLKKPIDMGEKLKAVLSEDFVNELGLDVGQSKRLRCVTPFRLAIAILSTLCGGRTDSLADILRTFNAQNGTSVAYKAFYNRLAQSGFSRFCRALCFELMQLLTAPLFSPSEDNPLSRFSDIVIQDATSFGLKRGVSKQFGGGASQTPLARLHVSLSGFRQALERVILTGDKTSEQRGKMSPKELAGKLFLGDRAYASVEYFTALCRAGASFCIRLPRFHKPQVIAYVKNGALIELPRPVHVKDFVSIHPRETFDLIIRWNPKHASKVFRLLVFPSKEEYGTWICTNLEHCEFPAEYVGKLYRFRWQIELLFKEWKSHVNLHRFDTTNQHISEGLIWAALATATLIRLGAATAQANEHVTISTRRAAKSAAQWLLPIFDALLNAPRKLQTKIADALKFLAHCAPRANIKRDCISGSLNIFEAP